MSCFVIEGGTPLYGDVTVSGSKNAALPVIFATIITRGVSTLTSVPDIGDVKVALSILSDLGAVVSRSGSTVTVDTTSLEYSRPDPLSAASLRASTYLIGSCLSRFGRVDLVPFGGCNFSHRPIDMHISAATSFGAEMGDGCLIMKNAAPSRIHLRLPSVGATVNALLMAASVNEESIITGAAREPHLKVLTDFLCSAGARIRYEGQDRIIVQGGRLGGGKVRIPGDMIEGGTYLSLSILTGGRVRVLGLEREELNSFFLPFLCSGASVVWESGAVVLEGSLHRGVDVVTAPYPGFPTDLQPIAAPLLAKFFGGSIRDTVWQSRYGYLTTLSSLGVEHSISDGCARILPSTIRRGMVSAPDLRGGAAAMLLALCAEGESRIDRAEVILRGYENPCEKLRALGAVITKID